MADSTTIQNLVVKAGQNFSSVETKTEYTRLKSQLTSKVHGVFYEWQRKALEKAPRREVDIDKEPGFRENLKKENWGWFRKNFGVSKKDLLAAVNMAEMMAMSNGGRPLLFLADANKPDGLVWSELIDMSPNGLMFGAKMLKLLEKVKNPCHLLSEGQELALGVIKISEIVENAKPEEKKKNEEKSKESLPPDKFTCSCCFQSVARRPENRKILADHGFSLKNHYRQGICDGSNYPPLQDGTEGLDAMIEGLSLAIEKGADYAGNAIPKQVIRQMEHDLEFRKALRMAIEDKGFFSLDMLYMGKEKARELAEKYDERKNSCPQL